MKPVPARCVTYLVLAGSLFGGASASRGDTAGSPAPSASTELPATPGAASSPTISTPAARSTTAERTGTPAPSVPAAPPIEPAPSGPARVDEFGATPSFASDPFGAIAGASDLTLKVYGDTGFTIRNNAYLPWTTATSNADVYAPGVWNSFSAPRFDLFASADVGKLSFLSETMFEANDNNFTVDIERMQIAYLFENWLRIRAGRSHLAWGYYNDTYHHGNLFELTTSRPFSVNFEDSFGIVQSHNVGVGIDGTFDIGAAGLVRYDADVGNGRAPDVTSVALQFATKNEKAVNVRLRWMPIDGLILGINGMRDVVPPLPSPVPNEAGRPSTEELVAGAHVVYTENHFLVDTEVFAMRHNPIGADSTDIYGGFAEIGYSLGAFTPYVRPEYLRFPAGGDIIYQYSADSAQGALVGGGSIYSGSRDFTDVRLGVKWTPIPQLALKLEVERLARGMKDQEIATAKAAFGF